MLCDWCCCGSSFVHNIWTIILCSFFVCAKVDCSGLQSGYSVFEGIYCELQVSWPCGLYGTIVRGTMAQKAWEPLLSCSRLLSVPRMSFRKMTKKVKQLTLYISFTRRWNDWQGKTKENLDCLISHVKISERNFMVYAERINWKNWVRWMKQLFTHKLLLNFTNNYKETTCNTSKLL